MALPDRLNKTLTIQTRGTGKDALGGISSGGFTNRLAGVACTLYPAQAKTVMDYAKRDVTAQYEIVTAVDISAAADERVVIGGKNYTVVGYETFDNATFGPAVYVTVTGIRNAG